MRSHLQTGIMPISLALAALIGCGSQDQYNFQGTWNGSLSSNQAPCSDGSQVAAGNTTISVTIMSNGSKQLFAQTQCGELHFTQVDNIATQSSPVTCPPMTTPVSQVTQTIHDTSLVLTVNALQVNIISDYAVAASGKTSSCKNVPATGVLIRTGS
jgi:hypothetical protein